MIPSGTGSRIIADLRRATTVVHVAQSSGLQKRRAAQGELERVAADLQTAHGYHD